LSLEDLVVAWAEDRGILDQGTIEGQLCKLQEEVNELKEAYDKDDRTEYADAIGDCAVVLIILAEMYGLDYRDCLSSAYGVIAKRKGRMIDGVFVKDVD
jgi:NTP pyrophosphatase (non-canonical NTP hydrolase)